MAKFVVELSDWRLDSLNLLYLRKAQLARNSPLLAPGINGMAARNMQTNPRLLNQVYSICMSLIEKARITPRSAMNRPMISLQNKAINSGFTVRPPLQVMLTPLAPYYTKILRPFWSKYISRSKFDADCLASIKAIYQLLLENKNLNKDR